MTRIQPDDCREFLCPEAGNIATIAAEVRALATRVNELREDKREAHDSLGATVKAQGIDLRAALADQTRELKLSIETQAKELREMADVIKSWKMVITVLWAVVGLAATLVGWHYKSKA